MKWFEVRNKYPNRIVLVEALETSSQNHIRTVREMSILSDFQDSLTAWQEYKKLHKDRPEKELYLLHVNPT